MAWFSVKATPLGRVKDVGTVSSATLPSSAIPSIKGLSDLMLMRIRKTDEFEVVGSTYVGNFRPGGLREIQE